MVELSPEEAITVLRVNEEKIRALESQKQQLMLALQEISLAKNNIEPLPEKEKNALIPIGSGILLPVKTQKGNLKVSVGAGIIVEKSVEDTLELLNEREEDLKDNLEELDGVLDKNTKKAQELSNRLKAYVAQQGRGDVPVIG